MAANSDDNPFGRNSAWPRMPQTPFRVGRLPAADPQSLSESSTTVGETSLPQTITPLFVRPMQTSDESGLSLIRRPEPRETSQVPPPAQSLPEAQAPLIEVPVEVAPAVEAAPIQVEVPSEPVFAQRAQRLAASRTGSTHLRKRLPAIVATLVGLGGLIGLVVMLSGQRPPPVATVVPAVPVAPQAAPSEPAPLDPVPVEPVPTRLDLESQSTPTAGPVLERIRPTSAPTPRAIQPSPAIPVTRPPASQPPTPAAVAIRDMFDAPVLTLPPARPPLVVAPALKPQPEDPSAPITTRAPFS